MQASYRIKHIAHAPGIPERFPPPVTSMETGLTDHSIHHGSCVTAVWQQAHCLIIQFHEVGFPDFHWIGEARIKIFNSHIINSMVVLENSVNFIQVIYEIIYAF